MINASMTLEDKEGKIIYLQNIKGLERIGFSISCFVLSSVAHTEYPQWPNKLPVLAGPGIEFPSILLLSS